jgi:hypothetical protein
MNIADYIIMGVAGFLVLQNMGGFGKLKDTVMSWFGKGTTSNISPLVSKVIAWENLYSLSDEETRKHLDKLFANLRIIESK